MLPHCCCFVWSATRGAFETETTYPSVLAAARAGVDGAVRVTEQVVVGRTTLAIGGILLVLPLVGNAPLEGPGGRTEVIDVGLAGVVLGTCLTGQAPAGLQRVEFAGGVDPFEVDVGGGQTGEGAHGEESSPHGEIWTRESRNDDGMK